jgi:hypothetical protein
VLSAARLSLGAARVLLNINAGFDHERRNRLMVGFRRPFTAAVAGLIALGGAAFASAAPAAADTAPAPDCYSTSLSPTGEICVPQTWIVATKVVTDDGLVTGDSIEFANNSSETSTVSQAEQIQLTLTAGISGTIGLDANDIAQSLSSGEISVPVSGNITPSAEISVTYSQTITGTATVPPQCVGTIYFGISYIMADVQAYSRSIEGIVTSAPELAWAPTGIGYSDGFQVPVPGPTPPNPACVEAASVQPIVPTLAQFDAIIAAGPQ